MIIEFFSNLVRQRVNGAKAKAQAKVSSGQARVKARAAARFNGAVDGAAGAALGHAKGRVGPAIPVEGAARGGRVPAHAEATVCIPAMKEPLRPCVGWLVALNGPLRGLDYRLVTGRNIIGTAADGEVVLTDACVSSRHAVIRYDEGRLILTDLDSTNGCYVNGGRRAQDELLDNDTVLFGRTALKVKALH